MPKSPIRLRNSRVLGTAAPEKQAALDKEDYKARLKQKKASDKARLLACLRVKGGLVTLACAEAGLDLKTYNRFHAEDPDFRDSVEEIMQAQVDMVEAALLSAACPPANSGKKPDVKAMCFYLSHKGARNGYRTAPLLGLPDSTPIGVLPSSDDTEETAEEMDDDALLAAVRFLNDRGAKVVDVESEVVE